MRKEITNLGYNIIEIKSYGRKSAFAFEGNGNIDADSMIFFSRQGKVEPQAFWETLKGLKALTEQR